MPMLKKGNGAQHPAFYLYNFLKSSVELYPEISRENYACVTYPSINVKLILLSRHLAAKSWNNGNLLGELQACLLYIPVQCTPGYESNEYYTGANGSHIPCLGMRPNAHTERLAGTSLPVHLTGQVSLV